MSHLDFLSSQLDVSGRTVADIGAGTGAFAAKLHEHGAVVTGIEIDEVKVEAARSTMPGAVTMLQGRAEDLPLPSASQDLVCFMFSFHHVPEVLHDRALAEAARVLKPGGRLHVAEPRPCGTMFDVVRLVDDEMHVRTVSHRRMESLDGEGPFSLLARKDYGLTRRFRSVDDFIDRIVFVDPARAERLPGIREELETRFLDGAEQIDGQFTLSQPCSAYHFARTC